MDPLKLEIKQLIISSLDLEDMTPDDIADDALLFAADGLALDSIDALELGVALRRKYDLKLESGDSSNREHFRSVDTLASLVRQRQAAAV